MLRHLALVLSVVGCHSTPRIDPLVQIGPGLVRGLRGNGYSVFLGLPYARVNETNVFGPSIPLTAFEGTFEAFDDSVICPQANDFTDAVSGGLDCLTLNIYVPDSASAASPAPVMVWIHGGAFEMGSSIRSYNGPEYLIRHDVILVTVQYRLGPYGFLCLDTPDVPGNQGLKDQLVALKWIKANIDAFGGNSNSITLFGTSAGAMSIDFHLMATHDEKLFHRAVMQSGAAVTPRVTKEADRSVPLQISAQLGFVTEVVEQALAYLSRTDVELVVAASRHLGIQWRTCPERDFDGVEKYVADFPINTPVPKAASVDILAGYNSAELATFPFTPTADIFAQHLDLIFDFGSDFLEMERLVRRFYIGDEVATANVSSGLVEFLSDFTFNYPVQSTIEKILRNGASGVYYYVFSYGGERGAAHGDEQRYLLDSGVHMTEEMMLVRDRMTAMWTNFAKYGDPTPITSDLLPVKWAPATAGSLKYLDIGAGLAVGAGPYSARMAFWDLFFELNRRALRGYREDD